MVHNDFLLAAADGDVTALCLLDPHCRVRHRRPWPSDPLIGMSLWSTWCRPPELWLVSDWQNISGRVCWQKSRLWLSSFAWCSKVPSKVSICSFYTWWTSQTQSQHMMSSTTRMLMTLNCTFSVNCRQQSWLLKDLKCVSQTCNAGWK